MEVFVVGGTGLLGAQVVGKLIERGSAVTALVRDPAAATSLAQKGVRLVPGDLKDSESLKRALDRPFDGLITTAYGYGRRRRGDTLHSVDDIGNKNLIAAARRAGVGRFVFTSILTADKATTVPHFHQKAQTERVLESSGLDWVALRPGGFLDTLLGLNAAGIAKGRLAVPTDLTVPASTILSADVATYLADAVTLAGVKGERIDIGTSRPTSIVELARLLSQELGRPVHASRPPAFIMGLLRLVASVAGGPLADNMSAMAYVGSRQYVADTRRQTELFGPPPTIEDSVRRWVANWRAKP